ncbi:hypothetical protein C8Q70DRAFT_952431 [Cubamyces menziesii]|uniref:Uncharacterized protein n=1 Tax=Trametes cubensis TaxID=1111947 RepID=A0AAD7U4H0_9APHY|nr:hypothetical protein C8Q70DRAFT_952431 [Cubamyces menziesii]KAJ8496575.1 hypothetical protein ONZ51_g1011 [Trametes cubensis]
MIAALLIALAGALPLASGHASIWHPSIYGFNVTDKTFDYDNRPVAPLMNYSFQKWWFHGHLDYPPNPGDFFELPAGKPATTEIACNKGATTWFNSSEGGDIRQGDNVCPNSSPAEYHTTGPSDLKGCALAIAYESDVTKIQPEDFTVFSINQTCVWTRFTDFQVPARMPPCPPGGCHCAWFWIHSQDSGGEQNYMTGFKCNVTGSTSNVPLAKPQIPRRCGADPDNGKPNAAPGNCTYGAKQPFYWFQAERNNMFEGTYSPPFYLDLYNFKDGAQDDIFVDSYPNGLPAPSPNSTFVPTPFLGNGVVQATAGVGGNSSETASSSSVSTAFSSATTNTGIGSATSGASSGTASISSTSATLSASILSQTTSFSASLSSSLSPELPVSTTSVSLPSASATESDLSTSSAITTTAPAESVALTTSTVISTLVVTVTAQPASGSTTAALSSSSDAATSSAFQSSIAASAQSSFAPASATISSSATTSSLSSVATAASSTASSSVGFATAGASTIFLNGPSSSTPLPSSAQVSTSASTGTQSASNTATQSAIPTTIDLNFAVDTNQSSSSVKGAVRPAVLAAVPTNAMCKRQFRRKVALRRRTEPSAPEPTQIAPEAGEEPAILSRINLPGLRRHRKLQQRSSLWHLF